MLSKPKRIINKELIEELKLKQCQFCYSNAETVHHLLTVGHGGPDIEWNLVPICHRDHEKIHKVGINGMIEVNPKFKWWLLDHGWEFNGRKWIKPSVGMRNLAKKIFDKDL